MNTKDIVRVWKDRKFRQRSNEVPAHPAGISDVHEGLLEAIGGGSVNHCASNNGCGPGPGGTPGRPCEF